MLPTINYGPVRDSLRLPNYFSVSADMSSATWNTVASHEIATVTGMVHMIIIPECTETLVDAADAAYIQFGYEGLTTALIASTGAAGVGGNAIAAGEIWIDATPADVFALTSNVRALDVVVNGGLDIGYEITGAALTEGTMVFHVFWEAINATGAVVAGAGGTL